MSFDRARAIADAVLFEGYVLYPYRSCSTKNRYRWTFGVLAPREWSDAGGCEPSWLEAQVLVEGATPRLRGRLRFLQVVDRRVEVPDGNGFCPVVRLEVGGRVLVPWEEGEIQEIDFDLEITSEHTERVFPFVAPGGEHVEMLHDPSRLVLGRVVRERAAVDGNVRVRCEHVESDGERLARVSVRVENVTPYPLVLAERALVMRASCISAHVLLEVGEGRFISLFDPPARAHAAAMECTSTRAHPVLVGEPGRDDLMLCSPIIMHDHPQIAPESPGDFFDATEIDAMLALRTKTLTPAEKTLARATDPRAAALLDRVDALSHEAMTRLHGTMRDARPVGSRFTPGQRVRLRLDGSKRRTDAQDLLYSGRTATIAEIRADVDGREYLLVTLDDDPSAEMHRWKGRFHHYYPDEVELLDACRGEAP